MFRVSKKCAYIVPLHSVTALKDQTGSFFVKIRMVVLMRGVGGWVFVC